MKKLEIEIPAGKEVDWEASAEQKQIVLKDKQLTYEDMCQKLFKGMYCFIDICGQVKENGRNESCRIHPSNAKTPHQLKCILAKNMLANTARYLNGEWDNFLNEKHYSIWMNPATKGLHVDLVHLSSEHSNIIFKSMELCYQAIKILGEETVKLALTPLY